MHSYQDFLHAKRATVAPSGIDSPGTISGSLFEFQRDIVKWSLKIGKSAIWADCGLGKSWMALEWARVVADRGPVLILTPLAVAAQFVAEHGKMGSSCPIRIITEASDVGPGINVCNYEKLHKLDPSVFAGVVLDESSILKNYTAKTRNALIEAFEVTPFKLCCTATPSPNDFMELGNHAEFLGAMTRAEMLAMFFVHDGGETQKWRLKGHAESEFWKWVCSWAVCLRTPGDLGYSDEGYRLPPLMMHQHVVSVTDSMARETGMLFALPGQTLIDQRRARKASISERVRVVAEMVNDSDVPWLVWCDLNKESESAVAAIDGAVEVAGRHTTDSKESRMLGFSRGETRVLVTKPSIAGFGMNWQHCANVAFLGITHSFESWYQAIRRSYRFGQKSDVHCHIVVSDAEMAVVTSLERKQRDAETLAREMASHMGSLSSEHLKSTQRSETRYNATGAVNVPSWLTTEAM